MHFEEVSGGDLFDIEEVQLTEEEKKEAVEMQR